MKRCLPLLPPALLALCGCAAVVDKDGIEQRAAMATGMPVGSFTITDQVEGTGGRIDFNVQTQAGARWRCYLYSATAFQRAMSLGQTPHSDAICSRTNGDGRSTSTPSANNCNALTKAAGKC